MLRGLYTGKILAPNLAPHTIMALLDILKAGSQNPIFEYNYFSAIVSVYKNVDLRH